MRLRLGDFTGNEGLRTGSDGGLEIALCASCAPCHPLDGLAPGLDAGHGTLQHVFELPGQHVGVGEGLAVGPAADEAQVLLAEAAGGLQAQHLAQLRVVAQSGMGVERQVVGQQIDVMRQEQAQALLHPAGDGAILPAPEQAVMHENRAGTSLYGGLDQRTAGGDTGNQLADPRAAFHLQAIGAVVLEALGLKFGIAGGQQRGAVDGGCLTWGHCR